MLLYIFKRILDSFFTLLLLITITFFLTRAAPGGPFDQERTLPPEIEKNLRQTYHLDEPLYKQYVRYVTHLLQGDFGPSFQYRDLTVAEIFAQGVPVSFHIAFYALMCALFVGIPCGAIAAVKKNHWSDHLLMTGSLCGMVIPNYILAPLFSLFFGVFLGWCAPAGWEGGGGEYLFLPVLSLTLPHIACIAKLVRNSYREVLHTSYIRAARANGIPLWRILLIHASKPAMMPIITYISPAMTTLVMGSMAIESIYGIPGIGVFFVYAAFNRDYTLILGCVILVGTIVIFGNLLVDLIYSILDPRIHSQTFSTEKQQIR